MIGFSFWPTLNKMDGTSLCALQPVEKWAEESIRHSAKGNRKRAFLAGRSEGGPFLDDGDESRVFDSADYRALPERPLLAEQWFPQPQMVPVVNGIPDQLDRIAALGNAVVPQVAEWIGRRIMAWEASK